MGLRFLHQSCFAIENKIDINIYIYIYIYLFMYISFYSSIYISLALLLLVSSPSTDYNYYYDLCSVFIVICYY